MFGNMACEISYFAKWLVSTFVAMGQTIVDISNSSVCYLTTYKKKGAEEIKIYFLNSGQFHGVGAGDFLSNQISHTGVVRPLKDDRNSQYYRFTV